MEICPFFSRKGSVGRRSRPWGNRADDLRPSCNECPPSSSYTPYLLACAAVATSRLLLRFGCPTPSLATPSWLQNARLSRRCPSQCKPRANDIKRRP
eukprot:728021-Pyramimonas_sp.AAC.1